MGIFRNSRSSRLPADTVARMEKLGRFELNAIGSEMGGYEIHTDCIEPFIDYSTNDPAGFIADLRNTVLPHGGLAVYGASCCVVELLGQSVKNENFLTLLDAAIMHKRDLGLPAAFLKGYELSRWNSVHGSGSW